MKKYSIIYLKSKLTVLHVFSLTTLGVRKRIRERLGVEIIVILSEKGREEDGEKREERTEEGKSKI